MTESHTQTVLKSLTDSERAVFQFEFNRRRKDPTHGLLFCMLLGGIGGHRFYLGQNGLGVLYLLFVWTLVPSIIATVECFSMVERVHAYNDEAASEIFSRIQRRRGGSQPSGDLL